VGHEARPQRSGDFAFPNGGLNFTAEDEAFFGLAEERGFPIAIHIGSFLGESDNPSSSKPKFSFTDLAFLGIVGAAKAGAQTLPVTCDLLFSGVFEKFPKLKLVLVEANIGWIPTLLEQTDDMFLRYRWFTQATEKMSAMPSEIFHRNFWATFMIDSVGMELRHRMNINHLLWSTDYPHTGSDWPNSRVTIDRVFRGIPKNEVRKMLHENVKALYDLKEVPDRK